MIAEKINKIYPDGTTISYYGGKAVLEEENLPDILFLDIQMPEMDGMETARELRRMHREDKKPILIFVTAIEDYVFQAFDVGAFHYLVKPFADEKFAEVLKNAVAEATAKNWAGAAKGQKQGPDLLITAGGSHIVVNLEDLVYAEVFDRKVILHTLDADIEYYGKMKELEKKAGDCFFRPHRAYLVNFAYIKKYDATSIELEKGRALMAKQNYREFVRRYLKYNQHRR